MKFTGTLQGWRKHHADDTFWHVIATAQGQGEGEHELASTAGLLDMELTALLSELGLPGQPSGNEEFKVSLQDADATILKKYRFFSV